jgi:hypothetical protein
MAKVELRQIHDHQLTCQEHWQLLPLAIQQEIRVASSARVNGVDGSELVWARVKRRVIHALTLPPANHAAAS